MKPKKNTIQEGKTLPLRIIQSNDRVAEVQVICDNCGKLVKTSLMPKKDAENQLNLTVTCYQCKQEIQK